MFQESREKQVKKFIFALLMILAAGTAVPPAAAFAAEKEEGCLVYGIGSVSKMFSTAAVLKLVERGIVELDAPVTKYLPEFEMADQRYKRITVRMLLNHSSGLMGTTMPGCFLLGETDLDYHGILLENLRRQRLKADPGAFSVYCNDGFSLAEMLVERMSGMSFSAFLEQEITGPLGMVHTSMPGEFSEKDEPAPIYFGLRKLPFENIRALAAGGIYSTPEELCRFSRIFMEDGGSVLSDQSVAAMAFPEYRNDTICVREGDSNFNYGLGWDSVNAYPFSRFGITALSKGGDTGNYHTGLIVLPEAGISAAVTVSGADSESCMGMAKDILLEVLKEEGLISEEQEQEALRPEAGAQERAAIPEEMKKYEGIYAAGELWSLSFTDRDTALLTCLENDRDMAQEYVYTKDGSFVSTEGKYISYSGGLTQAADGKGGVTKFRFSEEPNGKTYMLGTTWLTAGGEAQSAVTQPFAEKVQGNELSAEVKRAWEARDGRKYYLIDDACNSSVWLTQPSVRVELLKALTGYTGATAAAKNCKIADADNAVCRLELPVMTGRDLADYHFYRKEGAEYLSMGGYTFLAEDAIPRLAGAENTLTLKAGAQWFSLTGQESGVRISVRISGNGAYYVYDENDDCVTGSLLAEEKETILLPENGKLLLTGEEGAGFTITRIE